METSAIPASESSPARVLRVSARLARNSTGNSTPARRCQAKWRCYFRRVLGCLHETRLDAQPQQPRNLSANGAGVHYWRKFTGSVDGADGANLPPAGRGTCSLRILG